MNKVPVSAFLMLSAMVVCAPAQAQTTPGATAFERISAADVEQELRELDRQWAELAVRGDAAAYDRLTDEHHLATHASGQLVTRAEERSYLAKSASRFAAITTDDVRVRVDGDTAVILGRVTVKMRSGTEGQYRYTTVWLKRSDRWRLIAEQHTRIEAPPR
jgi:ketosteroid isomerase-like protein